MSASNGGDKGKRGKKFRPPAKGKDDDGQAELLAKCDERSEEARQHLEKARPQPGPARPARTRSQTAGASTSSSAGEKPRGKR